MNSDVLIITSILVMGVITFILRAFPLLVPKRILTSRYLRSLNVAFPISVMMLLVLNSLGLSFYEPDFSALICKAGALVIVFVSYYFWRNVFVSIMVGIASVNGLFWGLGYL